MPGYRGPQLQRQLNQFRDNPLVNAGQTAVLKRALSASGGVAAGGLANSAYYQSRPITAVFAQAGPLMSQLTEAGLFVSGDVMMVSREQTQVNDLIVWGGQTFKVYSQARRAALDTAWVSHLRLMYNAPVALPVAAAFTPAAISGLQVWLDAQVLGSLFQNSTLTTAVTANADPVGGWVDQSGRGNTPIQATAGSRQAYATSGINGHPAVQSAGGARALIKTFASPIAQPGTVFVVAQFSSVSGTSYSMYGPDLTNTSWKIYQSPGNFIAAAGTDLNYGAPDTSAHIFCAIFNGASSKIYKDGGTAVSGNAGSLSAYGIQTGLTQAGGGSLNGYIGEYAVYDSALSVANINSVGAYLSTKWGVTWTTAA